MQKRTTLCAINLACLIAVYFPFISNASVDTPFHLDSLSNLEHKLPDFEFQPACSLFCKDVYLEDSTYAFSIANGASSLTGRDIFQYNSSGLLTEDVNSTWQTPSSQWVNSKRFQHSYDVLGNRILRLRHDWNATTQTWVNKYKYLNTFDAIQNRTQSIRQNWDPPSQTWRNAVKYTYSYDANKNLIERIKQLWNGLVWVNNARYINTYNASNLRFENVKFTWNTATSQWNLDSKYDYSYDADCHLVLRIKSLWNGVSWDVEGKTEYSYDANGNLDFWVKSDRVGNFWVEKSSKFSFWRFFNFAPASTSLPDTILLKTDPIGTTIGNFITLDPDDSQFTYSFAMEGGQNNLDNALFAIDGNALVSNASFANNARIAFFVLIQIDDGRGGICTQAFTILVHSPPEVVITSPGPFCENEPVQTLMASPSGGMWGGAANASGQIDPGMLGPGSHLASYSFTDSLGFTDIGQIIVQINALPNVNIAAAGPFCETEPIQNLSANPAGGIWGGLANTMGQIDPATLGVGLHMVSYTFSDSNGCSNSDSMQVQVIGLPTAELSGSGSVCSNGGSPVELTFAVSGLGTITVFYAIDGVAQNPLSIANSPFILPVSQPGLYTITGVEDESICINAGIGSALVTQVAAPSILNFMTICDPTNTTYTLNFEIAGGDPSTYVVAGIPGTLSPTPPFLFVSAPIPSGTPYSLTANDENGCQPSVIEGSFSCNCATNAGTMNTTTVSVCEGEIAIFEHQLDEFLDGNDTLIFVLHDDIDLVLGSVLASNSIPEFSFAPPLEFGVIYYVSAVAGDKYAEGGLDFSDPCLSVSLGTPVVFNALPQGTIGQNVEMLCEGEDAFLMFNLSGNAPFSVVYNDGLTDHTLAAIDDGFVLSVNPSFTTTYTLISIEDSSIPGCINSGESSVTLTVNQTITTNQQRSICEGESIFLQGAFQTTPGVYLDTFSTFANCDSIVLTELSVNPADTIQINLESCNPLDTGTIVLHFSNQFGCDSLIFQTTYLSTSPNCSLQANSTAEEIPCNQIEGALILLVASGEAPFSYEWMKEDHSLSGNGVIPATGIAEVITGLTEGNYSINISSVNGGIILLTNTITREASAEINLIATSDFDGHPISCAGENDGSAEVLIVSGGSAPFSFQWLNGSTSNQTDGLAEGWHFVTATDSKGCQSIDSVFLNAPPPLEPSLSVADVNCFDGNSGAVTIDSVAGGSGPFLYSLNGSPFQATNQFTKLPAGAYEMVVQDANGCEATAELSVDAALALNVELGADQFIELGDAASLNASVNVPEEIIDTIIWTPHDSFDCRNCLNTIIHPLFTTTYIITVKTKDGCVARDQLTVFVNRRRKIFAPNAFSPNGDGNNDFFTLFAGSEVIEIKNFRIFDRHGNAVFEKNQAIPNDLESGWDGTFRGRKLKSAVFVYFAEIVFADGQTLVVKGDVVLLQ